MCSRQHHQTATYPICHGNEASRFPTAMLEPWQPAMDRYFAVTYEGIPNLTCSPRPMPLMTRPVNSCPTFQALHWRHPPMSMKHMPSQTVALLPKRSPRSRHDRAPTNAPSSNAAMTMPCTLGSFISGNTEVNDSSVINPPCEYISLMRAQT